jgi:ATP-dependent 26S proteasome regulatory subunit
LKPGNNGGESSAEDKAGGRAQLYVAEEPRFSFDQLVMPQSVAEALLTTVAAINVRSRVYDEWGLRKIEPSPSAAINLHGPPGTGKTLAAHAIAARLGMTIIMAGYAELESKYHGDGPKNVKAAFHAAERQNALLFIDEADSLLSRRLTNVTQGSEQAINSMRSQIVLCLDRFSGVVVFSTNLVSNYDRAFESRVRHFHFPLPDTDTRLAIWRTLLVPSLPCSPDVDVNHLNAASDGFSGREVKLAILSAAERAAVAGQHSVTHADLAAGISYIIASRKELSDAVGRPPTDTEREAIESQLKSRGLIDDHQADSAAPLSPST